MSTDSEPNSGIPVTMSQINQKLLAEELAALDALEQKSQEEVLRIQELKKRAAQELLNSQSIVPEPLDLSPEMADEAIAALKAEFDAKKQGRQNDGYIMQEGIDFGAVEAKLRAEENKGKLVAVYKMMKEGSRPAVVKEKGGRFCILETFEKSVEEREHCAYDKTSQLGLIRVTGHSYEDNAVDQAAKMGISLVNREIAAKHLIEFADKEKTSEDFIQATDDESQEGKFPIFKRKWIKPFMKTSTHRFYFHKIDNKTYGNCWNCEITYIGAPSAAAIPAHELRGWRGMLWV